MIVGVVAQGASVRGAWLAENLAQLRSRSGHRLLLLDAHPEHTCLRLDQNRRRERWHAGFRVRAAEDETFRAGLERLHWRFDDILIDTVVDDSFECQRALIAADVVVAAVAPGQRARAERCALIERLEDARLFNPGMRTVLAVAGATEPAALYKEIFGTPPVVAPFASWRLRRLIDTAFKARRR